ncbi:SIS domain-containing protein [Rhodoferax sp.]|uniref:SIS domain-containing protein n=1 Tax=Rhodoferax sp. TaxID=50421 RepID=UPI00374DD9E2
MTSWMEQEARSAPDMLRQDLAAGDTAYARLGAQLRAAPPRHVLTVARGSSDHAASYFAYLAMSRLGRLVTSLPMSLVSLEQAPLQAEHTLALAISQSGQSPDVIAPVRYFRDGGATTVALVNDTASPLAQAAEHTIGLAAGTERSVAATKSFIASLVAGLRLVAHWQDDAPLISAIQKLPEQLALAAQADWSPVIELLAPANRCMVVGRGLGLPIALEAALKLKETSSLQAEAFSGAEIKHGPMVLIEPGYPLLVFALRGPALPVQLQLAKEMRERGANVVLVAPPEVAERDVTLPQASHPAFDPICAIQAFYILAAQLAAARGLNPDQPRHLQKVTQTH